ncbi:MAG TPA: large conductance mechanosensitive channel protein MscL [Micropruina sp.]|nr:large conductance mechanosensitive channel protein MscL [Micropruina sp.]
MLKGFRDYLMRGNLIDVAVAFVIGVAFTAVTTSFTAAVIEILAKLGGAPDFKSFAPWGVTSLAPFLTALVSFVIMAFVIYFGIVVPYERIKTLSTKADTALEAGAPTTEELLTEIRDLLRKG